MNLPADAKTATARRRVSAPRATLRVVRGVRSTYLKMVFATRGIMIIYVEIMHIYAKCLKMQTRTEG
jgi:hypothetical protein